MIEIYGEKWILKRRRQKRKLNGYNWERKEMGDVFFSI